MTCAARRNYLFRTFAGAVACVFFVHEMSFAGDVIDSALDRLALEQSQTFAPDYLGERQSFNENVVDEKQALEDLSAARYPAPGAEDQADEGGIELQGPKVGSPAGFQAQQGSLSGEDAQASSSSVFNITTQAGDTKIGRASCRERV